MTIRTTPWLAVAAVAALGAAACTQGEQDQARQEAAATGEQIEQGAAELGERIESGAMRAAQSVEEGAGEAARRLEENQAEAAAEGRTGAVDPATGERVE